MKGNLAIYPKFNQSHKIQLLQYLRAVQNINGFIEFIDIFQRSRFICTLENKVKDAVAPKCLGLLFFNVLC